MARATLMRRIVPQWAKDVTRPLRRAQAAVARELAHAVVRPRPSRAVVNAIVNLRVPRLSARLLDRVARASWHPRPMVEHGFWRIRLVGRTVAVRLRPEVPLLTALMVLQHDSGVKRFYFHVLRHARPDLFLDVGANAGIDSFVFLGAGVPTISFEPNAACHVQIRALVRELGIEPRIEPVALGDAAGEATLVVPEGRSWLGSIEPGRIAALGAMGPPLGSTVVPVRRLDDWLPECAGRRVVIKIDTEAHEPAVLRGAAAILREVRPAVVLEALRGPARGELHEQIAAAGYTLRLAGAPPQQVLSPAGFAAARRTNFLALPKGDEAAWGYA